MLLKLKFSTLTVTLILNLRQSNDHLAAAALCEVRLEEVEQSGLHATHRNALILFFTASL